MDRSTPAPSCLQREHRDGVLALTLDRPECLNAIDAALARELLQALQDASRDSVVAAVHGWGLAWKLVDDAELESAAWDSAAALARLDPAVAAEFKKVLNSVGLAAFERAVAEESRAQRKLQAGR